MSAGQWVGGQMRTTIRYSSLHSSLLPSLVRVVDDVCPWYGIPLHRPRIGLERCSSCLTRELGMQGDVEVSHVMDVLSFANFSRVRPVPIHNSKLTRRLILFKRTATKPSDCPCSSPSVQLQQRVSRPTGQQSAWCVNNGQDGASDTTTKAQYLHFYLVVRTSSRPSWEEAGERCAHRA